MFNKDSIPYYIILLLIIIAVVIYISDRTCNKPTYPTMKADTVIVHRTDTVWIKVPHTVFVKVPTQVAGPDSGIYKAVGSARRGTASATVEYFSPVPLSPLGFFNLIDVQAEDTPVLSTIDTVYIKVPVIEEVETVNWTWVAAGTAVGILAGGYVVGLTRR